MPSVSVQVTLAEALEVRGGPLQEVEIWSILNEAARTLSILAERGMTSIQFTCRSPSLPSPPPSDGISVLPGELSKDGQPCFIPSPELLLLTTTGRVHFTLSSMASVRNKDLVPPEYLPSPHHFSLEAIDKVFIPIH